MLEDYIESLDEAKAAWFLKFVSGAEIPQLSILINFNSETASELMVPSSFTCSPCLHLSKYFTTYDSLATVMNNILKNEKLWCRFDNI